MIDIKCEKCSIEDHRYKKSDLKGKFLIKGILLLLFSLFSCTQKKTIDNNATVLFKDSIHNFKKISKSIKVKTVFKFSNVGESQLLIYDVKTSCGCTTPKWTKEVIEANEDGIIEVNYDANHIGNFSKTITVLYNGKKSPQLLTIKGEVVYTKEEEEAILKNSYK